MKQIFEITEQNIINEILNNAEYGTLAICSNNKPYSLPLNFVQVDDSIYFHGSKKGRKIGILPSPPKSSSHLKTDNSSPLPPKAI